MDYLEIKNEDEKVVFRINNLKQFNLYNINPFDRGPVTKAVYNGEFDKWLRRIGENKLADSFKKLEDSIESYVHGTMILRAADSFKEVNWENLYGYEKQKQQIIEEMDIWFNDCKFELANESVLLYGPPGCGKTALAAGFVNKSKSFPIKIATDVLLNSEMIRETFAVARAFAPCTMILEEIDAVSKARDPEIGGGASTVSLLNEFDEDNKNVAIIATTNYPWLIDTSIMRSGRFTKRIFVGPPNKKERTLLLNKFLSDIKTNYDFNEFLYATKFHSVADIKRICLVAKRKAYLRNKENPVVTNIDLEKAIYETPSTIIPWIAKIMAIEHPDFAKDYFPEMFKLVKEFEEECDIKSFAKIDKRLIT